MANNLSITITFGDQAENHVGMQQIGELADCGFTKDDLIIAKNNFENIGCNCELFDLRDCVINEEIKEQLDEAYILIIHGAVNNILKNIDMTVNDLLNEQKTLDVDKKAKMYGRVVIKHARHNVCFSEESQEPDYENGKGRIVSFDSVPLINYIRNKLPELIGEKALNLQGEGNYYYDKNKCGIGYHGDTERRKVVAIRLGELNPLSYLWFYKNKYINSNGIGSECAGKTFFDLEDGSMYIMSEKAVGTDWKKKNIYTLRHAAGCSKYISLPV